jgi:anti-sigma regulatory factor (Ser/Thr protein kinase)
MAAAGATTSAGSTGDQALTSQAFALGSLTIPGHPEHVSQARAFVAKILGEQCPVADAAVLLTSEVVTNAVLHSNSCWHGGTVRLCVFEAGDGIRVEVADDGSDLSAPVVKDDILASDGHGLYLVQSIANQWGYLRDEIGTTVWFWLDQATACYA